MLTWYSAKTLETSSNNPERSRALTSIDATNVLSYYLYQTAFRYFKAGLASSIAIVFFVLILAFTAIQQWIGRRWVHYG